MIFYFSGTGNSKHAAEEIAAVTGENAISLNKKIKEGDYKTVTLKEGERLVFVAPTYGWRIPRVVEDWIKKTEFKNAKNAWFVLTCGGEIGHAYKYIRKLCLEKGFDYMGTAQVLMPENYVAMFRVPDNDEARETVKKAEPVIEDAAKNIFEGNKLFAPRGNYILYSFLSGAVNRLFYAFIVKSKKFWVKDNCVSCGKCVEACSLNNVSLQNGKPIWGNDCTHCMACICYCPQKSIEYGKKSKGKNRYNFENL